MKVWDLLESRYLSEKETAGKTISLKFLMGRWSRLKFSAKVALSSGYYSYGETFVKDVYHEEIRLIMNNLGSQNVDWSKSVATRVSDPFSEPEPKDKVELELQKFLCEFVNGSLVLTIPGSRNVVFTVGILGKFIGMLNVPANTKDFPVDGVHDLGHAVILQKGKMYRLSYRELLRNALEYCKNKEKKDQV